MAGVLQLVLVAIDNQSSHARRQCCERGEDKLYCAFPKAGEKRERAVNEEKVSEQWRHTSYQPGYPLSRSWSFFFFSVPLSKIHLNKRTLSLETLDQCFKK